MTGADRKKVVLTAPPRDPLADQAHDVALLLLAMAHSSLDQFVYQQDAWCALIDKLRRDDGNLFQSVHRCQQTQNVERADIAILLRRIRRSGYVWVAMNGDRKQYDLRLEDRNLICRQLLPPLRQEEPGIQGAIDRIANAMDDFLKS